MIDRMLDRIGEDIVFKTYTGETTGNKALGLEATRNYSSQTVKAIVKELDVEVVNASGGVYRIGDIEVKLKPNPEYEDRIEYESQEYRIEERFKDEIKGIALYKVRCKKI